MSPERIVADPESDPTATWALDPGRVRGLTSRAVVGDDAVHVTTVTPLSGAPLAALPQSTPRDVVRAVAQARAAQPGWAARTPRHRAAVLLRLHDLLLDRQSEILDIVQLETGKTRLSAYEEVADIALNCRWLARRGPRILSDRTYRGIVPVLTQVTQVQHPKGVVGVIAPWNFPLVLSLGDIMPALLAGNAVVVKPDNQTALTMLWAADLLAAAGLPDGVLQVVLGDGPGVGGAVVDAVDHICFTGSTPTGRVVGRQAGERLISASLELGGKNGAYVADDADLDRAAEALVRDCFNNTGQQCIGIERLVLHEAVAEAFLDRFVDRVRRLRLSAGLDFSGDIGALTSAAQLAKITAHVENAVEHGAVVLAGGRPRPDIGPWFFEPTVLDRVTPEAACYAGETFGPVVSVYRVSSDAEALALVNEGDMGLNAAVWTSNLHRGRRLARQVVAGTVSVNEAYLTTWGSSAAPMGGRRASGVGRRHGREGILRFTESQSVAVQRVMGMGVLYGQGPERFAKTFTVLLKAARATRFPWP
ncbi:MAG: aldehyde dehydrogenase family protein [Actinobacteria bacterium]|nr:aldehyde dehydrogenase family protein [Actinomycetota bacterium]